MRGRVFTLVALLAVAAALPAASSSAKKARHESTAPRYKVVSATATATLTFNAATADSLSSGQFRLVAHRKRVGTGQVPGRIVFPLRGKLVEHVKTKTRNAPTDPYEESACSKTRKLGGRGGIVLRRAGSRIEVRWAFPQAKPRFCRGPAASKSIRREMKRLYPAKLFKRKAATVVIRGSESVSDPRTRLTYKWRATLKLRRL